jgi:hypothetical protein
MSSSNQRDPNSGWAATAVMPKGSTASRRAMPEVWEATRAQTAMAGSEDDYLATQKADIGRHTGADTYELFVSCDPGQALQQQLEHLRPEYIAVHDVGTTSARKLLLGIAAASSRQMQKLVIRRQGYGTPLATIEFIELPTPDGATLRIYTTDADADSAARRELARALLGFSRLGVLMVGDMPGHALATALQPLRDAMTAGPWPNRHLLLLPLTSASTLAAQAAELGQDTGVIVRTTPQVTRPAEAWGFINGAWGRILADASPTAAGAARVAPSMPMPMPSSQRPAVAPSQPAASQQPAAPAVPPAVLPMRPMPQIPSSGERKPPPEAALERYIHHLSELAGMVSCCIFDINTGRELLHAGASPSAADLASHGSTLLAAMTNSSRVLGFGHTLPEAAITLGSHHLLLRAVPRHPGLALHAVLDKSHANLTLARLQVLRMDSLLDEAPPQYAERRTGPREGPEARRG